MPPHNHLLQMAPPRVAEDVVRRYPLRTFENGDVLQIANDPSQDIVFVESGIVSSVTVMRDGSQLELGVTGYEGAAGVPGILGASQSYSEVMCQQSGRGYFVPPRDMRSLMAESTDFAALLLRFAYVFHVQVAQSAACNARHDLPHRLARWLLAVHDRTESDELFLTQHFISVMLGVRRPSVSLAAAMLQKAGVIRYQNGRIVILDRRGLEEMSCECHEIVSDQYRLMFDDQFGRHKH